MHDRAQEIGLFRYSLARAAADASLSGRERGALVRALAAREHLGPDGRWVRVSRTTLDRWIRAYRQGGFAALVPSPRRVEAKTPEHVLELACALRREQPARTAAHIHRIICEADGWAPTARTLQRHLANAGLPWKGAVAARAYGRFEAERPNALWTGDALHGPVVQGRKSFLFCFLDDHSRLFCGYRWSSREDVLNASRALRGGLAARGVPGALYVDNGSPFVSFQLLRACAVLGIRLIHSRPGRPEGRGKVERAFRTVREQFLVELEQRPPADLGELNRSFQAWVESVYHRRVHSQTGQAPLERFLVSGAPTLPGEAVLREAFLWSERRTVSKTGTFGLHGNDYEVSSELAGLRVELVFDPLDLSEVEVRRDGRPAGRAVALEIKRHVHPRAQHEPPAKPPRPTGIDYLG
ncbi:MAG: DDE-type integrase/transposase/recombinase, partial [Actinobacteria bacterium]|nr:DDE-type integrase/transposase/recombinase [Actinomycetota bacterium]